MMYTNSTEQQKQEETSSSIADSPRIPISASEPTLAVTTTTDMCKSSITTYATSEVPFNLDQVRALLNEAVNMVSTDFAVNVQGAVKRVSGDQCAQGVKNLIKAKHANGSHDYKTAVFCSRHANTSLAVRLAQGYVSRADVPFSVLTIQDQKDAIRKKAFDIEEAERHEQRVTTPRSALSRTDSLASLSGEKKNKKKDKKKTGGGGESVYGSNGYATIRGIPKDTQSSLSSLASLSMSSSPRNPFLPNLSRPYFTPVATKASVLEEITGRLKRSYAKKSLIESDTVNGIIDELDKAVQELTRTEKLRAECEREAHSMLSFSLEMLKGLPLVYLGREIAVGTCLCIGENASSQKAPVCGKIDIVLYDLYEKCYVIADLKTTRLAVAEGEESHSDLPMEYKFLKRINVLQLQMYAALLEHAAGGKINVGYVLIMGFDPNRNYEYTTWRINFDPNFYLINDFSHPDQAACFYHEPPRLTKVGEMSVSGSYRPVAPYNTNLVAKAGALCMKAPLLPRDAAEALLPHRFVRPSPHRV